MCFQVTFITIDLTADFTHVTLYIRSVEQSIMGIITGIRPKGPTTLKTEMTVLMTMGIDKVSLKVSGTAKVS